MGKTCIWLSTILLGLLVLFGCSSPPEPQESPVVDEWSDRTMLADLKPAQISRIELAYAGETLILAKVPGGWQLPLWQNLAADSVYSQFLENILFRMKWGQVVSTDPADYAKFDLLQPFVRIRLFEGDLQKFELQVGKAGDSYRSAYVRVGERPEIRLVDADLIPATSRPGWLSREVWRLPDQLIDSISWRGETSHWTLRREEQNWLVIEPAGARLRPEFVSEVLPRLAWMRAGAALYQPDLLLEPGSSLRLTAVGESFDLELGPLSERQYQARRDGFPVTWQLAFDLVDRLETGVIQTP